MKIITKIVTIFALLSGSLMADQVIVDALFAKFTKNGGKSFSAVKGKQMWEESHMVKGEKMSCVTCHTADLKKVGKHYKTGKRIEPMAVSLNEKRFESMKHAKKWFRRNCKQVYARKCTAQEKGDFLAYIVGE